MIKSMRKTETREAEVGVMCFDDGRRSCKRRKAGGLDRVEKAGKHILPWSLQKEHGPCNTLILDSDL